MKFFFADVKRPLASVSATVDEGNIVVFGSQDSYIENTSTGQRSPLIPFIVNTKRQHFKR